MPDTDREPSRKKLTMARLLEIKNDLDIRAAVLENDIRNQEMLNKYIKQQGIIKVIRMCCSELEDQPMNKIPDLFD